jgi:3-oxoadipate enol-lactonase
MNAPVLAEYAAQTRREWTASVNGTGLRVEEVGAGDETVVFSPPAFANRGVFEAPVAALSDDFRCISYDHRGQGDSGFGARQPSRHLLGTESLYEDAVALLDHLGIDRCHWVGASLGTFIGIRVAARHPERVRSLVLIGPEMRRASRADLLQIELLALLVRASHPLGPVGTMVRRRITEYLMRSLFGPNFMSDPARANDREKWRQRFSAELVPEGVPMFRELFRYPAIPREMYARIQAPTLVIVGEEEYGGIGEALATKAAIPGARLLTIPRAGHLVLVEQPEAGTAVISEFIRSVAAN